MLRYIKPLLDAIQNSCLDFKLKYWNTDTKIVDKTITYYTKFNTNRKYNTDALNGNVYIDIWGKDMQNVEEATNAIHFALRNWQSSTDNIVIVDSISFADFGKEKDTGLNRINGQIEIRILFATDNN
jgi:hypothetical protein